MKKYFDMFVYSGFLVLSFVISVFSAFTVSWKYQNLDIVYGLKVLGLIMLITFVSSLPSIIFEFLDKKKSK